MAKLKNIGQVFHVPPIRYPPFLFPREEQMILKIAFVELWTYLLTSPNNFPSFKVTKTSSSSSQRIFGKKNVKRTRLIAYKINVRTYPTKNISMKCHLDFFKACFRLLLVRWSGGKSVACRRSSCLQRSCG